MFSIFFKIMFIIQVSVCPREEFTYSSLLIITDVPEPVRTLWLYVIAWLWAGFLVSKNLLPISFCHFDHVICLLMERTAHKQLGETELYNCVSSAKLWHCDDWHCCPKGTFIKEIEEGPECFLEKLYNEYQVFTTFSRAATELWVVTNFVLINWCYSKESTPEVCQKKRKIWYGVSNVQDRLLIILVWSFLFPGKGTGCWI